MRVNPNFTPDILTDLFATEANQQTAIQELATGKRVNVPSDDPVAAAEDVQNQALQSQNDQYLQNTSTLEGMLQTADSALSSVVTALNQAISLGVQGASAGLSSADQQQIAEQVQSIQSQVVTARQHFLSRQLYLWGNGEPGCTLHSGCDPALRSAVSGKY